MRTLFHAIGIICIIICLFTILVGYDTYGGGGIGFSSGSPIGSVSCGDYYIVDDNHVENNEDFTIILGGRYRTVVTSSNNTVHVTIIDNDSKSLFMF